MNPFFWSSSAAFFTKRKFKLKWLLNPNSTRFGQAHNVVKIFKRLSSSLAKPNPSTLWDFFCVFWGVGNQAKDLNFANETHTAFKCTSSPQPRSGKYCSTGGPAQRSISAAVLGRRQLGHRGEPRFVSVLLGRPAFKAVFLGKGRKEMTLSYI